MKWGIGDDPSLDDKVKVTVLASGFDMTIRENENKKGPIEFPDNHGTTVTPGEEGRDKKITEKEIEEIYGRDKVKKWKVEAMKQKYVVLKPSQFDDHEVIALLERVPAHNRDPHFNDEINHIGETPVQSAPRQQPEEQREGNVISF